MVCFGNFLSQGIGCENCKVRMSCKKETVKKAKKQRNKKVRQTMNKQKLDFINVVGGMDKTLQFIKNELSRYKDPVSTYKFTSDIKKNYNVCTNDKQMVKLLSTLNKRKEIIFIPRIKGRYWISYEQALKIKNCQ